MQKVKRFRWLAVGVVVGAVAFGGITAQAADKYDDRPFSGALEGTSTGMPNPDTGQIDSQSEGNLIATHVGNSTYTITASQDYARHDEEEHTVGNCAFIEDGDTDGLVITAANGDQLFGNIDDDRSVICAPDSQTGDPAVGDQYYSTIYTRVTGGTGRFEDATGWLFSEGSSTITGISAEGVVSDDEATILGDVDY